MTHTNEHYTKQALEHGLSPSSTMPNLILRDLELEVIQAFVGLVKRTFDNPAVLDMGCGNGYAMDVLSRAGCDISGIEPNSEMRDLAIGRGLRIFDGTATNTQLPPESYSAIYTERCLINILDSSEQLASLSEIHRLLRPTGLFLCIEGFTDGLTLSNLARHQLGLEPICAAHHNLYLDQDAFFTEAKRIGLDKIEPWHVDPHSMIESWENFASTHYMIVRCLYPLISKTELAHNSEFVTWMTAVLPNWGNYSPIKAFAFRKR